MTAKKVNFNVRPGLPTDSETWVQERISETIIPNSIKPASQSEPTKRLTIDIPADLHRNIKLACAARGNKIAEEIRILLLEKYGQS